MSSKFIKYAAIAMAVTSIASCLTLGLAGLRGIIEGMIL